MAIGNTGKWLKKRPTAEDSAFGLIQNHINDLFDSFWGATEPLTVLNDSSRAFVPKIDVKETETEVRIKADLPGLTQDQISVNLIEDALVIKGERSEEREEKDEKNVRRYIERSYGSFQRVIPLAAEVEHDKVDASFKNGVLSVILPKSTKAKGNVKTVSVRAE